MVSSMKSLKVLGLVVSAALCLTGCTEGPQVAAMPIPPGGLRRITRAPVDWELASQNVGSAVFRCKPLACAKPAFVAFKNRPPLARHPDPEALQHFALVDVPKNFLADDAKQSVLSDGKRHQVLLRSEAGTALERPAVLIDAKRTVDGKVVFVAYDEIFAGPVLLQVASTADTLAQAHANLDMFLAATTLTDGPAA